MSSHCTSLFIPSTASLSFDLCIFLLLFVAVLTLWLTPGGLAWALHRAKIRSAAAAPPIPGPSGLPLLGLALTFTHSLTHRTLSSLSQTFKSKPLMAFSVGFTRFVISGDPETAKEILSSPAFADRPVKESARLLLFDRAMGFAPYGDYWRGLRRVSAAHLFGPRRLACLGHSRREIGRWAAAEVAAEMGREGEVRVRNVLHSAALNNMMVSVFGKMYKFGKNQENGDEGMELEFVVREGYELLGVFNWSDHFPLLGWLDLQGVRKRSEKLVERVGVFVGRIVDEHRVKRAKLHENDDDNSHDFVDALLDLEESKLSDPDMIAVLWVRNCFNLYFRMRSSIVIRSNIFCCMHL